MPVKKFVKENSPSLFLLTIFLLALVGQAIAGHNLYNEEAVAHEESTIGFWRCLTSSDFGNAVMENWQSEYLRFALFAMATVWLPQKGSPESKELDKAGTESDEEQRVGRWAREDSPRRSAPPSTTPPARRARRTVQRGLRNFGDAQRNFF